MRTTIRLMLLLAIAVNGFTQSPKQICITVDDLPVTSQRTLSAAAKDSLTKSLLKHLTSHHVPAIGFVIGRPLLRHNQPDTQQTGLLRQWLNAGMELGNHTFAHKGYNHIPAAEYQQDVAGADRVLRPLLKPYGQRLRYFRHPFLQRGNTAGKRDSLVAYLHDHQYLEAPVSVDNADYLFSAAYETALTRKDTALASSIGKTYVAYMLACVHYYEAQADSLFKRPIAHILLTHANAVNAACLGTILSKLKQEGYRFISLDEALKDPAYRSPDTFVNNGGISWIHRWALTQGKRGSFFKGEPEVPQPILDLTNNK
ncbi:polysaccharide deacetylase family protein [Arsenicibacter rosenii]|uniref:Polysaccharide deacetylase n=1 Tax=Arsenicibacter rosenii TaxID=1750698 RepID=A0A1S2VNU8_9BACT|nr:polysaccharide deacetylase family protein [Arsenicibacter rosenii]OIN60443.1 polysaccharide deacetylase [Arsenicibacter rosenii]